MRRCYEIMLFVFVITFAAIPASFGWDELWQPQESKWTEATAKKFQDFPNELKGRFQNRCEDQLRTALGRKPTHSAMKDCIDLVVDAFYANSGQSFRKTEPAIAKQEDRKDRYPDVPHQAKRNAIEHCKDSFSMFGMEDSWLMINACVEQELRSYRKFHQKYGDAVGSSN